MPSLTGLIDTPSDRRLRSTADDAAVGGSAKRTWSFGGTDTRVGITADTYEDAPPGGAAGSITPSLSESDADNNRLTERLLLKLSGTSQTAERSGTPNGVRRRSRTSV
ncbi:hypothetical protein GCM10009608_29010 [Pseudonocardia alaniniphila]